MIKILLALVLVTSLQAQTEGPPPVRKTESNWQNWVFVTTMFVTAASALFIVSMDNGKEAPKH